MPNLEAYEANLSQRLQELRRGDPAYKLHLDALAEAIIFAWRYYDGEKCPQRILDAGCGLGFMTKFIKMNLSGTEVVGIDPSAKAIELAKNEHPGINFYASTAESFADQMGETREDLFDEAILNMVLHSVDDVTARKILQGIRKCLKPEGAVLLVVPTQKWLMRKLIEFANYQGMNKETGVPWVHEQLQKTQVALPIKITGGTYYAESVTIFNRTKKDYGQMLTENNFGVAVEVQNETGEISKPIYPYLEPADYFKNYVLAKRERPILISLSL